MSNFNVEKTIYKLDKDKCTGCEACTNACPVDAISMTYNYEGFLYPTICEDKCIGCGKCAAVCPELNMERTLGLRHPEGDCYASCGDTDLRLKSSSGGMFSVLAEQVYAEKGMVCGAVYSDDYRKVFHIASTDSADLERMRGSKYVQSENGFTYRAVKQALKEGKKVLYSGCPCQVAGLYSYLGDNPDNLLTVDIVCHGANSTYAYNSYIDEIANGREIEKVNFRDKSKFGWSTPVSITFKNGENFMKAWNDNKWYDAFLGGMIYRKNCYNCHYTNTTRVGDITLGDFWGVHTIKKEYTDGKGTSLTLINTEKGKKAYEAVEGKLLLSEKASLEIAKKFNGQLHSNAKRAVGRDYFFNHLQKDGFHKSWWYGHGWRYDVGLVGWWFATNYGSALTYYALGKYLMDMGKLPIMIRIPKMDGYKWETGIKEREEFIERYFYTSKERTYDQLIECNNFCDSFMLGSDQLWVSGYNKMLGYTFFLDWVKNDIKKIAYATSLGRSQYGGDEKDKTIVKQLLKRFDAISVRESIGTELLKNEFDIDSVRMLDPVFLCDIKHYDTLASNSKIKIDKPFIACYILDPTEEKLEAIKRLEHKYNMPAKVVIDMRTKVTDFDWQGIEVLENVDIEEFVYLIKEGEMLFTDSHHGVCFAMIYHKMFFAITNPRRGASRFESLFNLLEIKDCLLEEGSIIEHMEKIDSIDYEKVDRILTREKEVSAKWFKEALESEKKPNDLEADLFANYLHQANRLEYKEKHQ